MVGYGIFRHTPSNENLLTFKFILNTGQSLLSHRLYLFILDFETNSIMVTGVDTFEIGVYIFLYLRFSISESKHMRFGTH